MTLGLRKVRVVEGDYTVEVRSGGIITLNVGPEISNGKVVITGNLEVQGTTTTIDTANMTIEDNVILLNKGESGPSGITEGTAGLQIQRSLNSASISYPDAEFLFDESIDHYDPVTTTQPFGTFVFKLANGTVSGIRTNSIDTNGGTLGLINQGTGLVTVTGTSNYEQNALDYSDWDDIPPTGPIKVGSDPDVLVNAQAMIDYGQSLLTFFDDYAISEDDTSVVCFNAAPGPYNSYRPTGYSGPAESKIVFTVDAAEKAKFTNFGLVVNSALSVNDIEINDSYIKTTASNANLQIYANGSGTIQADSILQIINQASDPTSTAGYLKLYPKAPGTGVGTPGKTGLYFVNTLTSDELVAKNRALLFSILF